MDVKPMRPEIDVSRLPTVAFGSSDIAWWGTVGFMLIEGFTLALCAASLLYLRQNFQTWPPLGTPRPDRLIPAINVGLMLLSNIPAWFTDRAARRMDKGGARIGMVILSLFIVAFIVLRWYELWALNTRWDSNAYGSVTWTTLGFHATLLLVQACETIGMAAALFKTQLKARFMSDVSDGVFYWYFITLVWVPLYLLVFILPWVRT
jgi:cytochrome c oxidase subunit 3